MCLSHMFKFISEIDYTAIVFSSKCGSRPKSSGVPGSATLTHAHARTRTRTRTRTHTHTHIDYEFNFTFTLPNLHFRKFCI